MASFVASQSKALTIFTALDSNLTFPPVDLSSPNFQIPSATGNPLYNTAISKVALEDLTQGSVGGSGAFEKLMGSMRAHLDLEFNKGRITGEQYSKVYIEMTSLAMSTGLQLLLGREQAYWNALMMKEQAKKAEAEVIIAKVQLEIAKAQLVNSQIQAYLTDAQYALTRMQLASEDAKYELTWMQYDLVNKQSNTEIVKKTNIEAQTDLVRENRDAARAQVSDTRVSGAAVQGTIKRQRDLLEQQIASFKRSDEVKVAKLYSDWWITQKTIDETMSVPGQLSTANIGTVINSARSKVGL
jgi:hypothetical protein